MWVTSLTIDITFFFFFFLENTIQELSWKLFKDFEHFKDKKYWRTLQWIERKTSFPNNFWNDNFLSLYPIQNYFNSSLLILPLFLLTWHININEQCMNKEPKKVFIRNYLFDMFTHSIMLTGTFNFQISFLHYSKKWACSQIWPLKVYHA